MSLNIHTIDLWRANMVIANTSTRLCTSSPMQHHYILNHSPLAVVSLIMGTIAI